MFYFVLHLLFDVTYMPGYVPLSVYNNTFMEILHQLESFETIYERHCPFILRQMETIFRICRRRMFAVIAQVELTYSI